VGKYVAVSESEDYGKTWSPIFKNTGNIENPDSGTDIVYTKSGNLLLICNPQMAGRQRLTVFLSEDKGKTWPISRDLEFDETKKGEFSYPAIIQTRDGKIHATYTHYRETIKHAEFDEDWIRNK
jgi:predicted neuraminidase